MKLSRKLIPAVAMLLVSLVMMSTASYAWFTVNTEVEASNINLTVVAPVNMLISAQENTGYDTVLDLSTSNPTKKLLPASTATPKDTATFFAPVGGSLFGADGDVLENTQTSLGEDQTFQNVGDKALTKDSTEDGYYIDYKFYVKLVTGDNTAEANVKISALNIDGGAIKEAARVAVFLTDKNGTEKLYIFAEAAETVDAIASVEDEGKTLTFEDQVSVVGTEDTFVVGTGAVAVTVRIWIEGQDPDCVNANAATAFSVELTLAVQE